jgi:hypothetical protein
MPAKKHTPPRKPARAQDNPEQSKRFLEAAERAGASTDPKDLDRALKKIAPLKRSREG